MTPLDTMSGGRLPGSRQWEARLAICRHVRGQGERGPRWRKGSNGWRPGMLLDDGSWEPDPPCPGCGDGEVQVMSLNLNGQCFCAGCGEEWIIGDYDWSQLSEVRRYRADVADGLVEGLRP